MNERQLHYLRALGVEAWVPREQADVQTAPETEQTAVVSTQPMHIGPGEGACLLVCSKPEQSASKVAADMVRLIGPSAVWAWPSGAEEGPGLAQAIEARLFTDLVVFGPTLASELGVADEMQTLAAARIAIMPDLQDIASSTESKKSCWAAIRAGGLQRH